jgi:GNAT superfamily N-acetyltransferase
VVRRATAADWRVLIAHRHGMFAEIPGNSARRLSAHDAVYRRWILPRIRSGEVIELLVESRTGRVIASGGIWFRPEQPRPSLARPVVPYLFSMFTEPKFRRRGFARRIVREALRICRARGFRRVTLHAAPKGRPLYRAMGFERSWEMRIDL